MSNAIFPVRIRSVRFKAGGEIRLLPSPREKIDRELRARLQEKMDYLFAELPGKVAGYALVLWAADGDVGADVAIAQTSPYVAPAIPHLVAEQTRRVLQGIQILRALGQDDETDGAA